MFRIPPHVVAHLQENPEAVMSALEQGSPVIVRTAGRFLGLGSDEQKMLMGGLPVWVWVGGAFAAGVYAGMKLEKHRDSVPLLGQGKKEER